MDARLRTRLAELVGAGAVDEGLRAVTPANVEQVVMVCRLCATTDTPIAVTSGAPGGSAAEGLVISLASLSTIAVEPERRVVHAGAGATLAALAQEVAGAGLELVAELPGTGAPAHVGSLIAAGAVARRALAGVEAVLPTGERVGGRTAVLKDVTGYDVAGAMLGSSGRLGLVVGASLRVQPAGGRREPLPERAAVLTGATAGPLRAAFDPHGLLRPAG